MSKKKKKKFKNKSQSAYSGQHASQTTSTALKQTNHNTTQVLPIIENSPKEEKVQTVYGAHAKEYRFIAGDMMRVLVVNGLFLVAVLALYYADKTNPFLQSWYEKLF